MANDTSPKKFPPVSDRTSCDATQQMLEKARRDGVILDLDRGWEMKACPIGAESALLQKLLYGPLPPQPQRPV